MCILHVLQSLLSILEIGGKSSYTGIAPSLLIIIPMEIPKSSQGQFRIPGLEVTIAEEEEEGREKAKSDLQRGFAREKKWGEKPLPKKIVVFLLFFRHDLLHIIFRLPS